MVPSQRLQPVCTSISESFGRWVKGDQSRLWEGGWWFSEGGGLQPGWGAVVLQQQSNSRARGGTGLLQHFPAGTLPPPRSWSRSCASIMDSAARWKLSLSGEELPR